MFRSGKLPLLVWVASVVGSTLANGATAVPAQSKTPIPAIAAARDHIAANGPAILGDFAELIRIPNVGSDEATITANAHAIRDRFAARGVRMETVGLQIDGTFAPPVCVARADAPEATESTPTLGIYIHYDGQPVDAEQWTFGPWEPVLTNRDLRDGGKQIPFPKSSDSIDPESRLYGRGSGDDRAPILALLAALDALEAAGIQRTVNLVLLFEGEEEMGSPHLGEYLDQLGDTLRADAWLICDGPVHQSRRPQLVYGVRGITSMEITVFGADRGLHSGHYGNWAPNPGHRLARLLASMKDDHGRVLVDGFYDDVLPVEGLERALATMPDFEDSLRREFGLASTEAENASYLERILLPSLNIRGLKSATVGETARNIIPSTATAAIDIRLPKGCLPAKMQGLVEDHIRKNGYHIVREVPDRAIRLAHPKIAMVRRGGGYRAVRTSMEVPIVRRVEAATRLAAGDQELVLMPTLGGSLPLYLFEDKLKAPLVVVPIANHDDNQHAPDENLRIANLWYGIELYATLLTMPPEASPASAENPGG